MFFSNDYNKEQKEDIQKKIMKVSEVDGVDVHPLNLDQLRAAAS